MKATWMINTSRMDASRCAVGAWGKDNAQREIPQLRTGGGQTPRGSGESDLHPGLQGAGYRQERPFLAFAK